MPQLWQRLRTTPWCSTSFRPQGIYPGGLWWVSPFGGLTGWCEISRIGLVDLTAQGIEFGVISAATCPTSSPT